MALRNAGDTIDYEFNYISQNPPIEQLVKTNKHNHNETKYLKHLLTQIIALVTGLSDWPQKVDGLTAATRHTILHYSWFTAR